MPERVGPPVGCGPPVSGEGDLPMARTERENFMRNAALQGHQWIPANVAISGATWAEQREALEAVCLRHPLFFPEFRQGQVDFDSFHRTDAQKVWTDPWGYKWQAELDGLIGIVLEHPLADWDAFARWRPPEPPAFPAAERERLAQARAAGRVAAFGVDHGFFFMRMHYLRGYESFMLDVATGEPRLQELAALIERYYQRVIAPYVECGLDLFEAADDLGTQTNSMIGPEHFRRWILPTYRRLFQPVRAAGGHVFLHSDGYTLDLMDPIIESGVSIVNPQDLVNGIDAIARHVKGRVCIRCDVDRQRIVPFGTPGDVRELIREEVLKLGAPAGGLEFVAGIYPPTPARNVDALCSALEEFRTYWVGRP